MASFCVISCNCFRRCEYEKYSEAFVIENDFYNPLCQARIKSATYPPQNMEHDVPVPSPLRVYACR